MNKFIKTTSFIFSFLFLTFLSTSFVKAESLFVVTKEGNLEQNVLGDSVDVKSALNNAGAEVAKTALAQVQEIVLTQIADKTHIKLEMPNGTEEEVADNTLKTLVAIEKNDDSTVSVKKADGGFEITQGEVSAMSQFPLRVDPKKKLVKIETSEGIESLDLLPEDALRTVLQGNVANRFPDQSSFEISRNESGELVYNVKGEKAVEVGNLTTIVAPVNAEVSVSTGKILHVDQPRWLPILTFLFG